MNGTQYTLLVLEAYEDEVAGAAYFDGLALAYPQQSSFLQKCATLERSTANRLLELLRKYQLTPSEQTTLEERGALDARIEAATDWETLIQQSIKSYARYVAEILALEALGPIGPRGKIPAKSVIALLGPQIAGSRQAFRSLPTLSWRRRANRHTPSCSGNRGNTDAVQLNRERIPSSGQAQA